MLTVAEFLVLHMENNTQRSFFVTLKPTVAEFLVQHMQNNTQSSFYVTFKPTAAEFLSSAADGSLNDQTNICVTFKPTAAECLVREVATTNVTFVLHLSRL